MSLFARWALCCSAAAACLTAVGLAFVRHVHGAPLGVALAIVAITLAASALAGRQFWKVSRMPPYIRCGPATERVRLALRHVDAAMYTCQVLAACGAILGVYLTASVHGPGAGGSATAAVSGVLDAMSNGLLATFTGIVCSLVLFWQHHWLLHHVER